MPEQLSNEANEALKEKSLDDLLDEACDELILDEAADELIKEEEHLDNMLNEAWDELLQSIQSTAGRFIIFYFRAQTIKREENLPDNLVDLCRYFLEYKYIITALSKRFNLETEEIKTLINCFILLPRDKNSLPTGSQIKLFIQNHPDDQPLTTDLHEIAQQQPPPSTQSA